MKIFILATVALTLMLSLGSILRPVQDFGVGPTQVLHLMGYFLPITLTFVLPIAALFASALVYGRFTSDNELDACRASGISILNLVYPGMALAIMVTIANLLLSFHVMPVFVEYAEKALKADVQQIVFRNIQRKGYYQPDDADYMIYADKADLQSEMLMGVIIAEQDKDGIGRLITVDKAMVHFISHGDKFNEVQITAENTYQMEAGDEGGYSYMESFAFSKELPSFMGDDIKFKKIHKMKEIALNPMDFYPIEKMAAGVYAQFATELLAADIARKINGDLTKFYRLGRGEGYIDLSASSSRALQDESIELSGQVIIRDVSQGEIKIYRCPKVMLYMEGDKFAPTLSMELYNAKWLNAQGIEEVSRRRFIHGLLLPEKVTPEYVTNIALAQGPRSNEMLSVLAPKMVVSSMIQKPSPALLYLAGKFKNEIQKMLIRIEAEIHSRLVFGMGCVPLILIGIGLGIIKRGGHLLAAFGVSAIPAVVLIVFIMMGKNVTKNPDSFAASGIALIWSGVGVLWLLTFFVYRKLLKN